MRGTRDIDYALNRERRRDHVYRLKRRTAEILSVIHKHSPGPAAILDLGTAEGRMLSTVRQVYPPACCIGIDYILPLLTYGKELDSGLNLICADIQELGLLKDETFDVAIAAAVIEHLERPLDLLSECRRILTSSGILIITMPHPFWEKIATVLGLLKEDHQSVMSPKSVMEACRAARLRVLEHRGFMLTPAGCRGEQVIEKAVRGLGLGGYMANQLIVAGKI